MSEYWTICAEEALDEAGLDPSSEQTAIVAQWMESAHDNYGEQHGHVEASKSLWAESERKIESLQSSLRREQDKIPCPVCAGKTASGLGGTTEPARYTCDNCGQTGKVDP